MPRKHSASGSEDAKSENATPQHLHQNSDVEQAMLGGAPGLDAVGRGPSDSEPFERKDYNDPTAGWGAARSVGHVLLREREPLEGVRVTLKMNQENGGFDCPGCAWPDDPNGLHLDICENGIKHATW